MSGSHHTPPPVTVPPDAVSSVSGRTGAVTLTKTDVGLADADNTADVDKPVSDAAQTELDLKVDTAGDTMTGALAVNANQSGAYAVSAQNSHAGGHGFQMQLATGTNNAFSATAFGDTDHSFLVDARGKTAWGSGAGARDTFLYRDSAGKLKTDGALEVVGTPTGPTAAPGTNTTQLATTAFAEAVREALAVKHSELCAADYNLAAWNYPWYLGAGASILATAGLVYVVKIPIPKAMTVTNVEIHLSVAGSGLTSGQCLAGLFSGAKALLSETADQSTAWASNGRKTMALTTPQAVAAGYAYVALFANGTTLPTPIRNSGSSVINSGLAAADSLWATADTGRTTSMPANLGTFTASSLSFVVGVS